MLEHVYEQVLIPPEWIHCPLPVDDGWLDALSLSGDVPGQEHFLRSTTPSPSQATRKVRVSNLTILTKLEYITITLGSH